MKPSCPSVSLEARPTISRATLSLSGEMKPEASSIDAKDLSHSTHEPDGPALSTGAQHLQSNRGTSRESHGLTTQPGAKLPPLARFTLAAREKLEQMLAVVTAETSPYGPNRYHLG